MAINFYYDKITDVGPVPNGITSYYDDNLDVWPLPFGDRSCIDSMVEVISSFFYSMQKNNVEISLFTGNDIFDPVKGFKEDIFYPFEVSYGINVKIPHATLDYLRAGKMKVLLLGQTLQGYNEVIRLRHVAEMFMRCNVPIKNIIIVTADMNNSYQELLHPYKSYCIDWWQIEARLIINEDTVKYKNFFKPINEPMPVLDFNMDKWNPKLLYHNFAQYPEALNCTELHTALEANDLYDHGTIIHKDDNINYHKNSLISILTPWAPNKKDKVYVSEVNSLFTDLDLWQILVMGKPFIVFGSQQIMKYLNQQGYFTFFDLINEKYDTYVDANIKADLICRELTRIKNNRNTNEVKDALKMLKKFAVVNRAKFLERSHMPMFLNLFDKIRYG